MGKAGQISPCLEDEWYMMMMMNDDEFSWLIFMMMINFSAPFLWLEQFLWLEKWILECAQNVSILKSFSVSLSFQIWILSESPKYKKLRF